MLELATSLPQTESLGGTVYTVLESLMDSPPKSGPTKTPAVIHEKTY